MDCERTGGDELDMRVYIAVLGYLLCWTAAIEGAIALTTGVLVPLIRFDALRTWLVIGTFAAFIFATLVIGNAIRERQRWAHGAGVAICVLQVGVAITFWNTGVVPFGIGLAVGLYGLWTLCHCGAQALFNA